LENREDAIAIIKEVAAKNAKCFHKNQVQVVEKQKFSFLDAIKGFETEKVNFT
jgi:hypothetical protein